MKKELGGKRLGNSSKMEVAMKNYERSSHDLSRVWRSSMACGVLVPFMSEVALNGDTWKINLESIVRTLPTTGPLFGSFKYQLDVFSCPIRLYQGLLHNNAVRIGLKMNQVILPKITLSKNKTTNGQVINDNTIRNISTTSLTHFLGKKHMVINNNEKETICALKYLMYYDTFKNYYANTQEENFKLICGGEVLNVYPENISVYAEKSTTTTQTNNPTEISKRRGYTKLWSNNIPTVVNGPIKGLTLGMLQRSTEPITITNAITGEEKKTMIATVVDRDTNTDAVIIYVTIDAKIGPQCNLLKNYIEVRARAADSPIVPCTINDIIKEYQFDPDKRDALYPKDGCKVYEIRATLPESIKGNKTVEVFLTLKKSSKWLFPTDNGEPKIIDVPLENIDKARREILKKCELGDVVTIGPGVDDTINFMPYLANTGYEENTNNNRNQYVMNGLVLKTFNSDLFSNWLEKEMIDGVGGVSQLSAVDITGEKLSLDALNLKQKIYNMLNRIVASGNTYEDWQEAIWGEEAVRRAESPIYCGGASGEIVFEEVVSQSETETEISGNSPIGTLAGRGVLKGMHDGEIEIDVKEPSIIMGIVSITPRVDYSEGTAWDLTELKTLDDLHKPELDGIGFQNLPSEWLNGKVAGTVVGKQPAWIQYMTAVNEVHGDFADDDAAGFMVLRRKFPVTEQGLQATTYIDPVEFNTPFAVESLSAQNFWVQIGADILCRRKMSAKIIPNL